MSSKQTILIGSLSVVMAAFLWSTDLFFRYDLLSILDPVSLVFLEHLIILIVLCPLFLSCLIPLFKLNRKYLFALVFIGVGGSAIGTVAFSYAFVQLNPVVPIVLQKLQPFVALLGAEIILKEKSPKYFYGWAFLAIVGAILLSQPYLEPFWSCLQNMNQCLLKEPPPQSSLNLTTTMAVLSALVAVFFWGMSTVMGRYVSLKIKPRDVTFLRIFFGFIGLFFWVMWLGAYDHLFRFGEGLIENPTLGLKLLYMALVIGLLGLTFYYQGMKRISAKLATLLELFYPVFSFVLATVFLQQELNWIQISGMGLIISTSTFCTLRGFK
jgi:drug/metabolite transporter (DMT)-like permease